MTEAEWWASTDPDQMLDFLGDRASPRKARLFACACVRRIWPCVSALVSEGYADWPGALEKAEEYSDGGVGFKEMLEHSLGSRFKELLECGLDWEYRTAQAVQAATTWSNARDRMANYVNECIGFSPRYAARAATLAAESKALRSALPTRPAMARYEGEARGRGYPRKVRDEAAGQAKLLREIFGNPFRSLRVDPSVLTASVASLTQAAYDERSMPSGELDTARVGVLSDALEEAGCTDTEILEHLRSPGPHVRGCWVVDLLLEKV